jgi:hypothetical protein
METTIIDTNNLTDINQVNAIIKSIFSTNDEKILPEKILKELYDSILQNHSVTIDEFCNICINKIWNFPVSGLYTLEKRNILLIKVLEFLNNHAKVKNSYNAASKSNPNSVFWPNHLKGESIYETDFVAKTIDLITPQTPVGSAGSCFAMEIASWMQKNNWNYTVTEQNLFSDRGIHLSCAAWGTIFNPSAFRQLIERSFGLKNLPRYLWRIPKNDGSVVYRDPFREEIEFSSINEYETSLPIHINAAREALTKVKVFIITLGLNEVWKFRTDGSVLSRNPWRISPAYVDLCILDVDDVVSELQLMIDTWRYFNPDVKIVISVSPVPMHATARGHEMHVATATGQSKATLRVAAQKFAETNEGVYYFPAFEKIMYGTVNPWESDCRHVTREAVDGVMNLFMRTFYKN